ncbi:MAG: hypothetical protein ACLP1Y_09055 [Candidatus Acidiferrales bacterium]
MGDPKTFLYRADQLGAQWTALEARRRHLDREFQRQARVIQKYLREHGSRPRPAPGMTVALGAVYELASIVVRRNTINRALAEKFLKMCPRRIARRALQRQMAYIIAAGAEKFLLREASARLLDLWRRAVKTKKLAPRIRVRELKVREVKTRRAA